MTDETELSVLFAEYVGLAGYTYLLVLLLTAAASFVILRIWVTRLLTAAIERTRSQWDDILTKRGVFRTIAYLAPALILYLGVGAYPEISGIARRVILAYLVVNVVVILDRLLSAGVDIYRMYPASLKYPIKSYAQLAKLIVYVLGAVTTIAVLLDRSPWGILGGVTAMTAILVLVFRNTILSLIASIQLTTQDLVHIGDVIEVPEYGADGEVVDVMLHMIKVQNWDKTIVTVPTYKLIDGSFKNWRGMQELGGRRITRSLLIDQTSIRFCDDELMERFWRIDRLKPYLQTKKKELGGVTMHIDREEEPQAHLSRRILTNLGTFRAYVDAYLSENTKLRKDLTFVVRQRPPSPDGLPLEVYMFCSDVSFVDFEKVQADIFDHLLAVLPYFELRVFQHPTGYDLRVHEPTMEFDTATGRDDLTTERTPIASLD